MDIAATLAEIKTLSVKERLHLIEEIWESIDTGADDLPVTEAQRAELERRLAHHLAHPEDVVPWDEVRTQALARARH